MNPEIIRLAMRQIWKYVLNVTDYQEFEMPQGAVVRYVDTQAGVPCLWAEVFPEQPMEVRCFRTYGTGHIFDDRPQTYLGSYLTLGDAFVGHVYEEIR